MPEAVIAACGNHAASPAVATCRRCGLFLCDACIVLERDESYCASCAERRNTPASRSARAAAIFPLLATFCAASVFTPLPFFSLLAPPLWIAGLALGLNERRLLRGDPDQLESRRWLKGGAWASALATLSLLPFALSVLDLLFHRH